jgi:hypothetical protein
MKISHSMSKKTRFYNGPYEDHFAYLRASRRRDRLLSLFRSHAENELDTILGMMRYKAASKDPTISRIPFCQKVFKGYHHCVRLGSTKKHVMVYYIRPYSTSHDAHDVERCDDFFFNQLLF